MYENFFNMYRLSKTLRFSLLPQGRTLEHMEEKGILAEDEIRAAKKERVQELADNYHRIFIDKSLAELKLKGLSNYYALYDNYDDGEAAQDILKEEAAKLIIQISRAFTNQPEYRKLFNASLLTEILPEFYDGDNDAMETLSFFDGFATYFKEYHRNREFIYSASGDKGTIAGRLINDNLPVFISNARRYEAVRDTLRTEFAAAERDLAQVCNGKPFDRIFDVYAFDDFLTQKGIDRYNRIIGGYAAQDGIRVKGLNEYINIYNHKKGNNIRLPRFTPLKKMILSEKGSLSANPKAFTDDSEVRNALTDFCRAVNEAAKPLAGVFRSIRDYDTDRIYLSVSTTGSISKEVFGSRRFIESLLPEHGAERHKAFSVGELDRIPSIDGKISGYFVRTSGVHAMKVIKAGKTLTHYLKDQTDRNRPLRKDKAFKAAIKAYLDAVMGFRRFAVSVKTEEADADAAFYSDIAAYFEPLGDAVNLYNMTRNYLSGRSHTEEKIKLNFGSAVLLDGWSEGVEKTKLGTILIRNGRYYLGIISKGQGDLFAKLPDSETDDVYQKMCYNIISGANKLLPHVMFSKKGISGFDPGEEILRIYHEGTFKKGRNFSLEDCHKLIDFYKEAIASYPAWRCYDFRFSDTKDYEDISGFYNEVEAGGYSLEFRDIDADVIDRLVDEGRLYMFEIWHKDFSEYSYGKPDLSTIYWRAVFDPENRERFAYRLNGGAEIFYRKASIKEKDVIRYKAGDTIRDNTLSRDIIKDRRFTMDQFQLNVPITMNATAPERCFINNEARLAILRAAGPYVIGVNRGEKSLIYITVLDDQGNVVEKRSLNKIGGTDYAELLSRRERSRYESRRSWDAIESIRQVKNGYLGHVVRELADLMLKYDAVIVMEDLSAGFKQQRRRIEKSVYQQLEEKLISKLGFLVNKDAMPGTIGEPFMAYQLTVPSQGFDKRAGFGRQTGFIFYVSPWKTTEIDSATGFVNLFDTGYSNVHDALDFWSRFDAIEYDEDACSYRFDFDYNNFADERRAGILEGTRTKWSAYSHGKRVLYESYGRGVSRKEIDITEAMTNLFEEYNVLSAKKISDGICAVDGKGAKEFHQTLLSLFDLMIRLRNGSYIISPVKSADGTFYRAPSDENGALGIARKGKILMDRIQAADEGILSAKGKDGLSIEVSANDYLRYVQTCRRKTP